MKQRARAVAFLLAALAASAQDSAIAVHVRDAGTKAPVADVELKLQGPGAAITTLKTGVDGLAVFEHLAPGFFTIRYTRAGYVDSGATGMSGSVVLKAGAVKEDVMLDLTPAASLEGTVFDEEGQPMKGVEVLARGNLYATTDAKGTYRVAQLPPGNYRIEFEIPYEVRQQTLKRDETNGETFGYNHKEYYPGVADPQAAVTVQVAGGLDLHGYDVHLRRVRLVEFSGRTVERAGGEPVRGARVSLQAGGTVPVAGGTLLERPVGEDGGFRFDLIQPDRYMLLVYRGEGSKALPWALPVEVGKTGVEDREIVVPRFPPLRVAIKVKSGEGWGGQVLFTLRSRLAGVQDVYATITSDQFALDEVPPGQWRVNLESNAVRRPELQHVTVAAARFGDVDALSDSITVTESGNPVLEVELSADTGRIAGTVAVESGRLPLVFMRRIGAEGGPLSGRSINVKPDGNFLIEDLAPGKYEVLAMGRSATRLPPAKPVEVKAGETAVVDLR